MACCRNVMLLVDTAGGAAGQSLVRRAALRLLIYLSCRFGLSRVRWAFRFFDSQGARSRPSRVSDFRELGTRSWEDFEEELEARLGDGGPGANLPGPAPRATHTHNALMEALLDYQWDRPEITSPTKPVLRSSSSSRMRLVDVESEAREAETALGGFGNAVFLLAPCPHSQRELLQFLSGCEAQAQRLSPTPKQVMEKLLPKRVQEVMTARKITLYWVDTSERSKLWDSPDHLGYWTVCGLLHHMGGTILPSGTFSQHCSKAGETPLSRDKTLSRDPHPSPWISTLPTDSTLNRLLYNSTEYDASFPRMEGTLLLPVEGKEVQEAWVVTLEPLTMHQRHFQKPVRIFLKGTATQWSLPMSSTLGTDSWLLQSPGENKSTQRMLFEQLVNRLTAEELHLVASVDPGAGWPPVTAVISPLSTDATVLTVLRAQEAEFQGHLLQTVVAEDPPGTACLLSEAVDVVLNQIHNLPEAPATPAPAVPAWARQELGRTASGSAAMEQWFRRSNLSGASSDLMESFWFLQSASSSKEESSKTESELTCRLSELYLRKSREEPTVSNQEDSKKKRGVPRTPVWRKMSSMCRSLKMLNVARLNVKAQKSHPDGSPDAAGENRIQRTGSRRTAHKLENRGRALRSSKPKDFKTEEELLSYIHENYQKAVTTGGTLLYSCAQNMIATIKAFLKSKGTKDLEVSCLNQIKSNLLKTSGSLRQYVGKTPDKEDKVRECRLQVFLRLEACLQCPSTPERVADAEQVVEEVVDLLRMLCLAEDSVYLAKFLEEILGLYIDSLPKTLGGLYHGLGFVIPQRLLGVLPVDFLSDDSMTQDSKSPPLSVPQRSVSGGTESEQLEELRTRSARKRRKNALIRHKSIADISQNLRQIEIPRVSKRATQNENSRPALQHPPLPVKDTVQEVTKVRRNLFNQEISPSKRSGKRGMPRSHSVSAVEGLEYKLDTLRTTKGYRRLLTRSVAETPVHKQSSRRLLHRQVKGRSSDPGPEIDVVEESPEKGELSLRRSPRIKQLSLGRTNSSSFYSVSQPKSRSVQSFRSFQQDKPDQRENSPIRRIQSPKRFFFGAVSERFSPSEKPPAGIKRPSRNTEDSGTRPAYQTPKKSHWEAPSSSAPMSARRARGWACPSPPQLPPQKGRPVPEGGASAPGRTPRTPGRPSGRPPGLLQQSPRPPSTTPSPERPSCPAVPAAGTGHAGPTTGRCSLGSPPRAAPPGRGPGPAAPGPPPPQKRQQPRGPRAPQPEGLAPKRKQKGVTAPKRPELATVTPSPPASAEEALAAPLWDTSHSPLGSSSSEPPAPGRLDCTEHPTPPSGGPCAPRVATSAPPGTAQMAGSDVMPPAPPPDVGEGPRDPSSVGSSFLQGQRPPGGAGTDGRAARREQQEGEPSAQPPEGRAASPLLGAGGTRPRPLLAEAGRHGSDISGSACPQQGRSQTPAAEEPPLSRPAGALSPPASEPSSPLTPPCVLRRVAHSSLRALGAGGEPAEAPGSPPTYDVELEMQASGLPKLRLRRRDAEPLTDDGALPGPSVPRAGKASGKPEAAYTSPPCPHPAHSTPGKSGGQTYICQACTPTRGPSSTPCPFQTPSPKCSGRTTPDALRDWPRRKRAGAATGRPGVSTDLSACLSPLPPEDLDLGVSKAPVVGDFELEGVCQLPDLSPPRDGVLEAEEAAFWGQFGLGSRKRHLAASEEAEGEAKRACEQQGGGAGVGTSEERAPGTGADAVPVSGSSPPPGCATQSCLSASGLQALTRSPLLLQGKTPSARARDADVDVLPPTADDSLFSHALSRRRATSRTYTRKKLKLTGP